MAAIFDEASWRRYLRGYTIYDCAIFRQHGFCLVLVEEANNRDILPRTRFLTVIYDKPFTVDSLPLVELSDFGFTTIACSVNPAEYVAVDTRGNVYSANAKRKGVEKPIEQVLDMRTAPGQVGVVLRVVRAADQVYALGDYRKIYRRIGTDQWVELGTEGTGVPMPPDVAQGKRYTFMDIGFSDLAAFSAEDIYAVGGAGDVWRFDGRCWQQCPFPSNQQLNTVCCAGDGHVYITDSKGCVWRGRESLWEKVADADIAFGFAPVDTVWFNNRLYMGSQEGLWALNTEHKTVVPLQEVEVDAPNSTNSGRLDVSPDGKFMLTAGPHGLCIHDGTKWTRLFSTFDFL
ncbi:hypothetical protein [Chitinivorax sp. B]|uniref:hypothetical protein n=1 Tax=Chitinivorax sp. B TaxID=2502235 RepID=UPI0010F82FBB|nr:hypothetical protein [Chitinivorax sp. B]